MVLESYISPLLKRYLSSFFLDIDAENIPLLGGDIRLSNLALNTRSIQVSRSRGLLLTWR